MKRTAMGAACTALALSACLGLAPALAGCGGAPEASKETTEQGVSAEEATDETASAEEGSSKKASEDTSSAGKKDAEESRLDLLVLVNKQNALPAGWEDDLVLEGATNSKGEYIEVDKIAFDAFAELQEDLEESEGITIELNSGYRSVEEQQSIWDEFMAEYGEEYVLEFVAEPGHSEHHTGLALDALLVEDGEPIVTNEDIFAREDTWEIIHSYLPKYGFILRYLDGQEDITGYTYEPWHIRYVGPEAAQEIMSKGITLEEYLGEA